MHFEEIYHMNKSKISSKSNTPRKEQTVKELFKSPDNIRLNHSKQGNVMMKNKQNPRYLKLKDEDEDKLHDKNVNIDDVSLCKSNDNMNNEINAKKEQVNAAEEFFSAPNSKENKIPEGTDLDINDFDGLSSNKRKRKKDWKSWSLTEKILFYEVIAKGGNHSSLQKLFETMKEKIGSKSTEKIRDYYYRALKNVNKLLKSIGENVVNRKNRDEVLLALNCYGKMITSSNSKQNKVELMKKLSKHPRILKRIAGNLKKLITSKIKNVRSKIMNSISSNSNRNSKSRSGRKSYSIRRDSKLNNNMNTTTPHARIINTETFRKIPFEMFNVRITPADQETYLKMIEANYSARIEISVSYNKSIRHILEVLTEKWKNVTKKHKSILYLCPLEELWISRDITYFSLYENSKAFDVGDIFTAYGSPNTNTLFMQYQWCESKKSPNELNHHNFVIENNQNSIQFNNTSNSLLAQPTINLENSPAISKMNPEDIDFIKSNESDDDEGKSCIPLEKEFDDFDPLEFLGVYEGKDECDGDNEIDDCDKKESPVKQSVQSSTAQYEEGLKFFNNIRGSEERTQSNNVIYEENSQANSKVISFCDMNSRIKSNPLLLNEGVPQTNENQLQPSSPTKEQHKPTKKKIPFVNNISLNEQDKEMPTTNELFKGNDNSYYQVNYTSNMLKSSSYNQLSGNNNTNFKDKLNTSIYNENKKEDYAIGTITNFMDNNSNLLNFTYQGLFDHESNMHMLRNQYNSNLFPDNNLFNSCHLNSIFLKNNEDTMLKKVSYDNNKTQNVVLATSNLVKENPIDLNLNKKIEEEDNSLLNKKVKRRKKSTQTLESKKSKKRTPITIEEIEANDKKKTECKVKEKSFEYRPINNLHGVNPYIINQNNYFNNFNQNSYNNLPNVPNNQQRFYYGSSHPVPSQLDIPHPSTLVDGCSNVTPFYPHAPYVAYEQTCENRIPYCYYYNTEKRVENKKSKFK